MLGKRDVGAAKRATIGRAERADAAIAFGDFGPESAPRRGIPVRVRARIAAPHAPTRTDLALAPEAEFTPVRARPPRDARFEFGVRDADRSATMHALRDRHER